MSLTCPFCQSRTEEIIELRGRLQAAGLTIEALRERIRRLEPPNLPPPPPADPFEQASKPYNPSTSLTYDTRPAHSRR